MKVLAAVFAFAFAGAASAAAGNEAISRRGSGADEFRKVVVSCVVAGMNAGATDPVYLAGQCVDATQVIWAAAYPPVYFPDFGP